MLDGSKRWLFLDEASPDDAAYRQSILNAVDDWWRAFTDRADDLRSLLRGQQEWDLPAWMSENLQSIHPSLMWEYGPGVDHGGHRLVITPESARHLRPLVETILFRAPKLPGWEFYGHRLPELADEAIATVKARTGGDLSDYRVMVQPAEHNLVGLTYVSPSVAGSNDRLARDVAFVATETLLGEEVLDKWIGPIEVAPQRPSRHPVSKWFRRAEPSADGVSLGELRATVDAVIEGLRNSQPPMLRADWIQTATWSLLKLQPEERQDYPFQDDLFVARCPSVELWKAAHSAAPFYGERFSRSGETLCFVKLDGSEGLGKEGFADKAEIEDALDEVLMRAGLGCVAGGGTGRRYSYIDLVLSDLQRGVAAVRSRLQEGRVPLRTWIQFYDATFAREWVGIYPDSPPPPMSSFDED